MNKKNLSVVMAGAMLATSVAPVLAAETTTVEKSEVSANNLGLLINDVRTKLNSKKFSDETAQDKIRNGAEAGKSVYFVRIDGEVDNTLTADATQAQLQTALGDLEPGSVVEIWSKGYVEEDGKVYANTVENTKFTEDTLETFAKGLANSDSGSIKGGNLELTGVAANYTNIIDSVKYDNLTKTLKVDFKLTVNKDNHVNDLTLKVGDNALDHTKYINETGNETSVSTPIAADKFFGFVEVVSSKEDIDPVQLEEITITSADGLKVEDLYDGLMLTEKGHELLTSMKNDSSSKVQYNNAGTWTDISGDETLIESDAEGKVSFKVKYKDTFDSSKTIEVIITGNNEKNAQTLAKWLDEGKAGVDLLAGSNRYETAVTIAKDIIEYDQFVTAATKGKANIVLVNGNSLVDGLSAAPLAASLVVDESDTKGAPILLTETDKLPTATKDYLKELSNKIAGENLENVTINIVGGTSVVSKSVEKELKSIGYSVNRVAGDNREETSLAVMEEINNQSNKNVFVVGANGEADAMSIAPVASDVTTEATPIIVAKNGGISEDALEKLEGKKVTVVGGEKVVTSSEYKAIEDAVGKDGAVRRIAGSNRQATNAAIINEYYTTSKLGTNEVLVAKDGMNNNSELIDSLSATILASKKKAPIVLATNKLTSDQINAIELNSTTSSKALYQIGYGVNRDIVKTLAERLGLIK